MSNHSNFSSSAKANMISNTWSSTLRLAAFLLATSQPAFATPPDFDFFTLGAIENFRSDQQWCEEHYPAFKIKNEAIFKKSIYADLTGESFINAHSSGESSQRLLSRLPELRLERQGEYAKMPPKFLEQMCTSFESHMGPESMSASVKPSSKP